MAALSGHFHSIFSNFFFPMAFVMFVHYCKDSSCTLNRASLHFKCCRSKNTFCTACKLEEISNKEKDTVSDIFCNSREGHFLYLVRTTLKDSRCLMHTFSMFHIDCIAFNLSSGNEL